MFSKLAFCALLSGVVGVALGCGRENEPPAPPIAVTVSGGGDCLVRANENLNRYMNGGMSDAEVAAFWDCTAQAVRDFRRLTTGSGPNGEYTPAAIGRFLTEFFFPDVTLGPDLLRTLMAIKKAVLAGSKETISKNEVDKLLRLIQVLKAASRDLNPFARLVFLRDQALSDAEILRAGGAINTVGARLADWFEREGDEYLFSDLSGLLSQIKSENGRFQDLIPALKRILIAGAPDRIAGDEWRLTAAALSRGYVAFLNLRHVTRGDLNSVLVRPELPSRIQELALILESGVERHPGGRIPGQEFKDLAAAITATGWLPKGAGPTAVHDVWVWLVRRPMSLGEGPDDGTLTLEILRNFTERLGGWRKLQQTDSADFARALKASAPMEWDSQGRIVFRAQGPATWLQRERMVWSFTFIDWIKESYVGSEPDELTTDQITRAAQEILPLLHGFGWMRSTTAKIGAKLLRESDLFTPSSNGDGRIQVHEGTRYLAYVASSFRAAELWLAQADGVCVKRDAECVRQVAANPATGVLDSLPRLKASLDGKGIEIFANYSKSAEETVLGRVVEGPYGTGDLLQTYMIFQYVENFLSRFDSDRSETVSLSESPPAFRLFGSTLEMLLSGVVPPEEMEAFFTFLLKYGNTPFTMFAGQVRWLNWKWHPDRWTFESDRTHLVGILNQLSKL